MVDEHTEASAFFREKKLMWSDLSTETRLELSKECDMHYETGIIQDYANHFNWIEIALAPRLEFEPEEFYEFLELSIPSNPALSYDRYCEEFLKKMNLEGSYKQIFGSGAPNPAEFVNPVVIAGLKRFAQEENDEIAHLRTLLNSSDRTLHEEDIEVCIQKLQSIFHHVKRLLYG